MSEANKFAIVGIVPRRNLWSVIQNQRWYHIPVKSAPRNALNIKYIGFYFPSAFGNELKYKVTYYTTVLKVGVVKRINLFPDEFKHPRKDMDYYQFHLGEIKELPRSIPSKRFRRIVHIPTTLKKLFTADEINDLYDTSPLEEKMYLALKGRNINPERQMYVYLNAKIYCLDFCIFCKRANIDLECDGERYHALPEAFTKDRLRNNQLTSLGWHVLRFSSTEVNRKLNECLNMVDRTINTLKGLIEVKAEKSEGLYLNRFCLNVKQSLIYHKNK